MYSDIILTYSRKPVNKYKLEDATIIHSEENRSCGDSITVFLKIEDNKVVEGSFIGETAIITTACASVLLESIEGLGLDEILQMDYRTIVELIQWEVTPRRHRASVLGLLAVRNAIHEYLQDGKRDDFSDVL